MDLLESNFMKRYIIYIILCASFSQFINCKNKNIQIESENISIERIDSIGFNSLYTKHYRKEIAPERITNFDSVKDLLQNRVEFKTFDNDETILIEKIHFGNGITKSLNDIYEGLFVAYFPEYDFILLEGGHTTDDGYDLTTGKNIDEAGNPADQTISPKGKYRISGVYGGQECSTYIIQKNENNKFVKIGEIDNIDLCYFIKYFWEDDTTFYFSIRSYMNDAEVGEMKYYRLRISEK